MSLEILEVNGLATFQGVPGWGRRHFGVPEGGAWDGAAFRAANSMMGNEPDALAMELSLARIVFKARQPGRIAVVGAPARVQVDAVPMPSGEPVSLAAGQTCEIGVPSSGARIYVAIPGGVDPNLRGKRTERGMNLTFLRPEAAPDVSEPSAYRFVPRDTFEIIPFGDEPLPAELNRELFMVGFQSNRVGLRLSGPPLPSRPESVSEPACHGMLQLDNSGSIIVLGPDGPTIGGYPKLGVIASQDLDCLGQLRPGNQIRFSTKARA